MKGHVSGGDDLQRRAAVLHAEVTATTQAIVTLTSWVTARCSSCSAPYDTPGCTPGPTGPGHTIAGGCAAGHP